MFLLKAKSDFFFLNLNMYTLMVQVFYNLLFFQTYNFPKFSGIVRVDYRHQKMTGVDGIIPT